MSGRDAAAEVLKGLAEMDGVYGACILSRDGLPVLTHWPHPADVDTLAAMGAALMGAAETSLMEFGDRSVETVLIVSEGLRLVILGVDDEMLLLTAMDRSLPIEKFDRDLQVCLTRLQEILAGA